MKDFQKKKESNQIEWTNFNKSISEISANGVKEKKDAIDKLIREFEHAEKVLIDAGAKTFAEMYPELPKHQAQPYHQYSYTTSDPPPYQTSISFRAPDLNEFKRLGYIQMFEAAWDNDLEKIKSLTLAQWKSRKAELQPPLRVAIQDMNGFSPFSIAVLRGHHDLARNIIEICAAQYHKDDGISSRKRWTLQVSSHDGYNEEDSDYDSDDCQSHEHLPIFSELVSDEFTVENLGEVATLVKSDVLPLTMINWPCYPGRILGAPRGDTESIFCSLLMYAVKIDDTDIFKLIMRFGAEQQALLAEDDDDQKCFTVDVNIFHEAISRGRTTMLAAMIKASGVGIPLNALIKKSGIEIVSKPRYYQGLSVGGKKRADWAQAPDGTIVVAEEKTPPLLQSAKHGSIDSLEWFMSNAPLRKYKEFAEANKHDKRIKALQAGNSFEKTTSAWLDAQSKFDSFVDGEHN